MYVIKYAEYKMWQKNENDAIFTLIKLFKKFFCYHTDFMAR